MKLDRREFGKSIALAMAGLALSSARLSAKTYLTVDQAKQVLWGDMTMEQVAVKLTSDQVDAIEDSSDTNVRNENLNVWKTQDGGWFIVDQVIGKHENIEILTYRETYGFEIENADWRAQFHGKDASEHLELDEQIQNITGATLSCSHITDGINRLTHTWLHVLKTL
jgi:Na+-translocating ferredoxin:NAD+ oxidoreductase RnfG subunit